MAQSAERSLEQLLDIFEAGYGTFGLGRDFGYRLAREGRLFYASTTTLDGVVTGTASALSLTAPTLMLRNPANSERIALPLVLAANQVGPVAGTGPVRYAVDQEDDDSWSSGGVDMKVRSSRPKNMVSGGNKCLPLTNPTTAGTYGVAIQRLQTSNDIEPAEGALQEILWTPTSGLDMLDPDTCLKLYTWAAGTPGPSWWPVLKWAEFPAEYLNYV